MRKNTRGKSDEGHPDRAASTDRLIARTYSDKTQSDLLETDRISTGGTSPCTVTSVGQRLSTINDRFGFRSFLAVPDSALFDRVV